jgi:hypothetical protein
MTDKVVAFPQPQADSIEVYLAVDSGAEFEDPRLAQLREQLTVSERARLVAQLRADSEVTTRRADAIEQLLRIGRTRR